MDLACHTFCVCYLHSILKEVFVCGFVALFLFLLHLSVCFIPYCWNYKLMDPWNVYVSNISLGKGLSKRRCFWHTLQFTFVPEIAILRISGTHPQTSIQSVFKWLPVSALRKQLPLQTHELFQHSHQCHKSHIPPNHFMMRWNPLRSYVEGLYCLCRRSNTNVNQRPTAYCACLGIVKRWWYLAKPGSGYFDNSTLQGADGPIQDWSRNKCHHKSLLHN
jgi:hypothetical protein